MCGEGCSRARGVSGEVFSHVECYILIILECYILIILSVNLCGLPIFYFQIKNQIFIFASLCRRAW